MITETITTDASFADDTPITEETTTTTINTELLRKTAALIEANAVNFDMQKWHGIITKPAERNTLQRLLNLKPKEIACGTTYCIAGYVLMAEGITLNDWRCIPATAQRLLKLTNDQATRLFYCWAWPEGFAKAYERDKKFNMDRAWVAVQRIDHFITTEGRE